MLGQLAGLVSVCVKNFDTIIIINVKFCMMVVLTELNSFILLSLLSVTFIYFKVTAVSNNLTDNILYVSD